MQLICRNDISDYETWRRVFDDDAEARSQAGLSLLQIWREVGKPGTVWFLCEVGDPDKARGWLDGGQAGMHRDRAGVTGSDYHFVDTA